MIRRVALVLGLAFVVTGAVNMAAWGWDLAARQEPVDFELNWVAAHRLVDREPLYDRAAAKADGIELVGADWEYSNTGTYASFIGTPATALLYTPFLPFSNDRAAQLYRWAQVLLILVAITITARALPPRSRLFAWLVGVGCCLWGYPFAESIGLGQVDGFIMVALALAIWASTRERWRIVGAALGIAALLKISPALLLVYLVLRGYRKVLLPAIASAAALLGTALVVGRPADVVTWITDIVPDVSRGGLLVNNQSLPAWLARLFGSDLDWLSVDKGLGSWRFVAWIVAGSGLAFVYLLRRRQPFVPLELGALIVLALLAGPISWDHYPTWAILTLVLMADLAYWEHRRVAESALLVGVTALGLGAMRKWTLYPTPDIIAADWTRRVESGSKTIGLFAFLFSSVWLLARPCAAPPDVAPVTSPPSVEDPARRIGDHERASRAG